MWVAFGGEENLNRAVTAAESAIAAGLFGRLQVSAELRHTS